VNRAEKLGARSGQVTEDGRFKIWREILDERTEKMRRHAVATNSFAARADFALLHSEPAKLLYGVRVRRG